METNHTPGSWEPLRQGIEVHSLEGNHEVFAYVKDIPIGIAAVQSDMVYENDAPVGCYHLGKDEGLANLYLIASAPDLLAALDQIVKALTPFTNQRHDTPLDVVIRIAQAAIDKATMLP